MTANYRSTVSIVALLFIIIVLVLLKIRSTQRRKVLEQMLERQQRSRRALLLYIMLNDQCSEEVAYQRIATFVKKHVSLDDQSSIDRMLAQDRQSLLDRARAILVQGLDEIDNI